MCLDRVAQDLVRIPDLVEVASGLGVLVGMVLHRKLLVHLLDRRPIDVERLGVILHLQHFEELGEVSILGLLSPLRLSLLEEVLHGRHQLVPSSGIKSSPEEGAQEVGCGLHVLLVPCMRRCAAAVLAPALQQPGHLVPRAGQEHRGRKVALLPGLGLSVQERLQLGRQRKHYLAVRGRRFPLGRYPGSCVSGILAAQKLCGHLLAAAGHEFGAEDYVVLGLADARDARGLEEGQEEEERGAMPRHRGGPGPRGL
mmetsp:Transcript_52149/g.153898  ORF Transcript_52149/g.153898 Transcript_52149/m.153898 type:complete len:255 (-) Transcript_52149:42-806(-)